MALTEKNRILSRYRDQIEKAKRSYLERTGKQIAVGFKSTEEYRRIQRNRRAALNRYEARKERAEAEKVQTNPNRITNFLNIADQEPFFAVLGPEVVQGQRFDPLAISEYQDGQSFAQKPHIGVITDEKGNITVYRSEQAFAQAVNSLYQKISQEQQEAVKANRGAIRQGKASESDFLKLVSISQAETERNSITYVEITDATGII